MRLTTMFGLMALVLSAVYSSPPAPAAAQEPTSQADGNVVGRNGAESFAIQPGFRAVGAASSGGGLWVVDRAGTVEALGEATHLGDLSGIRLDAPVVAMAATPTGQGYWLVAADGGVFSFGDATFLGSMGGITLNRPVVAMAATATGRGYRLVAADGGVFAFGDATFLGSTGGAPDPSPVVGVATNPDGDGYWLARADGAVVGFGSAAPQGGSPIGRTVAIAAAGDGGVWLVGAEPAELPGGGVEVFANGRMIVAHYGSPGSPILGILGELQPDRALQAVVERAAQFGTVGDDVVPGVEIIVTVAQRSAGADGDYSAPVDKAAVEALIDEAERVGAFVVLDLQPGRSTFLSQAVQFEDLLGRPHVGLALDPEWRMGPGQVPARVIGSVTAAEVNEVSAWLSEMVVRDGLPEKLFVIHQFTDNMVRDRDDIVDRPGLAITFHADGFGGRGAKIGDLVRYAGQPPFHTGFKLFLDEDTNLFSPAEVLGLSPRPDLVTYQ